ncbi:MAG TPA: LuxR C-terminal-related transcriptional regulator [Jatrophihabitans sp.]|nr:LuxR C-terminal-related transcriptional regulator [Jatrophihabitans sp.]
MANTDVLLDPPPRSIPAPAANPPVLATKVQPERLRPRYISRQRLIETVTRGVSSCALTLISGPAGSGKSILAASWAAADPLDWPIAWLTVDKSDNNPALFWAYVLKSLARAGVELPGLRYSRPGHDPGTFFCAQLAASLLERPRPVVVIIDNAEHLDDPEILGGIDLLLRRAADRLRIVLCTRVDPQLPLFRYRLDETISELRLHDLAFTVTEAGELFRAAGLTVSGDVATALTRRTEGWAAGLRLAASSLVGGAELTPLLTALGDGDSNVAEYLISEVLKQQDERTRQVLLRTSVVEQLVPELVDVLTDRHDGRRTLAALYHANVFIERDPRLPGVYRMHPLFRSMLAAQLSYEAPEQCRQLHLRCARWFAEHGQISATIEHAVAGSDWAYVATFLAESLVVGNLLARNRTPYERILRSFPAGVPDRCAAVLRVAGAVRAGLPVAEDDLKDSAGLAHDTTERVERRVSAAVVYAAACADAEPDPGRWLAACDDAADLISRLPTQRREAHPELASVVLRSRAMALLKQPDRKLFTDALDTAVKVCDEAGADRLLRQCEGELALVEALNGQLRKATEHAMAANAPGREGEPGPDQTTPASALALAWIRSEEGDNSGARRWLDRATKRRNGASVDDRLVEPLLTVLRARLLRGRREPETAERLLQPTIAALAEPDWLRQQVLLEEATLQLALGRPARVVATLDALPDPNSPRGQLLRCRATDLTGQPPAANQGLSPDAEWSIVEVVEAWLNEACLKMQHGQTGDAHDALKHALRLAQPERLRRPFLDASPKLIQILKIEPDLATSAAWLRPRGRAHAAPLAHAHYADGVPDGPVLTQPLTERELEVLRHLSDMLTTEEIGTAMYVSVNTVRTHVRSILQKLGVRRRHDAVRRARALGIL